MQFLCDLDPRKFPLSHNSRGWFGVFKRRQKAGLWGLGLRGFRGFRGLGVLGFRV